MKLYYCPGTCSQAVHICLREAGLKFEIEKVDIKTKQMESGRDFLTINPHGYVPVLELDDGTRLTEGPIVSQYIADRSGALALMPAAGSLARYRVMEWQNYVTSELHKSFTPLFHGGLDATAKKTLAAILRKKLEWVNEQLADKSYLTGDTFTAADAYLFVVLNWAKFVQIELANLKHIGAFMARVAGRPAVQAALKAEGLLA